MPTSRPAIRVESQAITICGKCKSATVLPTWNPDHVPTGGGYRATHDYELIGCDCKEDECQ